MPLERSLKRGNVRQFDDSYNKGFKSAWASEVDADFNLIFGQVNAGPIGPAGGDLTGDYPNPSIAPLAVTTPKLANDAVTNAKLADDAVERENIGPVLDPQIPPVFGLPEAGMGLAVDPTGTFLQWIVGGFSGVPGGPAGGDLGGTYPNPTVAKINGSVLGDTTTAPAGKVLAHVGGAWAASFPGGDIGGFWPALQVVAIFGAPLGPCIPTNGNILRANGTLWQTTSSDFFMVPINTMLSGHRKNLLQKSNSTIQVTITADELGIEDELATAVNILLNINNSGALGLDTGLKANNTWYARWALYNPSTDAVTGVFSLSYTLAGVAKPVGFTKGRYLGSSRTNGSGDLLHMNQVDDEVFYDEPSGASLRVLNSGGATVPTLVSVTSIMPPPARIGTFNVQQSGSSAVEGYLFNDTTHLLVAPGTIRVQGGSFQNMVVPMYVGDAQEISYMVTAAEVMTIYCIGYKDRI